MHKTMTLFYHFGINHFLNTMHIPIEAQMIHMALIAHFKNFISILIIQK